jgi:sarcosine oxidase
MFTNTPDEEFIIDTHPDHENITVGAGFSGRGFKFASVVGELLADVVQGTKTSVPTEAFRIDRFDR